VTPRRRLVPLALLALALGLGGCSSVNLVPRGAVELGTITPELTVHSHWGVEVGDGVGYRHTPLAPLLDAGRLYLADRYGWVYARDSDDGHLLWRHDLGLDLSVGIGESGNQLLLGSGAELIALAKADGHELWRKRLPSALASRPIRADDKLLLMLVDGTLQVVDSIDGRPLWDQQEKMPPLSLHGAPAPVVAGERVFAGFANGRLRALRLDDGEPIWTAQVASARGRNELERMVDLDARLQVGHGMVFAAAYQGQVGAYSLINGRQYWSRPDLSVVNDLLLTDEALYVSDSNGTLWALAWRDGATLWKQEALAHRDLSAPVQQGDYLLVGDYGGYLHWLRRSDGGLVARTRVERVAERHGLQDSEQPDNGFPEDRTLLVAPLVGDGQVFAMDKRGVLEAYRVTPLNAAE